MASMPHITVKVDSSQVQRLIEIADQLRRMSDDLGELIQQTLSTEADRIKSIDDEMRPTGQLVASTIPGEGLAHVRLTRDDPSTMHTAAAMHETVGSHTAKDSPEDPYGIDKSAREHTGKMKLTREMKLVRDDPDAIQAP